MIKTLYILTAIIFITTFAKATAQSFYLETSIVDSLNTELPKENHQGLMKFEDFTLLLEYRKEIIKKYHKEGFLKAQNIELIQKNDRIFDSHIHIGTRSKKIILYIENEKWPKTVLNQTFDKPSETIEIDIDKLESKIAEIRENWIKNGFSFIELQIQNIKEVNHKLYGNLTISHDEIRKIDSIIIRGYNQFPVKLLKYRFGLNRDKHINHEEILHTSKAIEAIGIAKQIKPPEILYEKNKSSIYFYLEKTNNNYFDGIIGFSTNEATGKLDLYGNLNINLNNNLNRAEKFDINYRADGNSQQELKLNLEIPFVINSPITPSGGIHIFKKDSTYSNTNLNIELKYNKKAWDYYIGYEQNKSVDLLQEESNHNPISTLNGSFFFVGINYLIYSNNNTQQEQTQLDLKLGTGKRETYTEKQTQHKLQFKALHNFIITKNHSLYTKLNVNHLWSGNYYSNELFRIGGLNDIRGLEENSIDASTSLTLQTEYRFQAASELYLHSITDLGKVKNRAIAIDENLIGIGFGLGIQNKLGLMKLQIANSIIGKEKFDFDRTRIHISLRTRF